MRGRCQSFNACVGDLNRDVASCKCECADLETCLREFNDNLVGKLDELKATSPDLASDELENLLAQPLRVYNEQKAIPAWTKTNELNEKVRQAIFTLHESVNERFEELEQGCDKRSPEVIIGDIRNVIFPPGSGKVFNKLHQRIAIIFDSFKFLLINNLFF